MYLFIEQFIHYMYDNIFFILITGLALYYLIFKRNIRFIEIQSDAELENETENRSDKRDTSYCNDPRCVRCNLYRPIIDKAKDRLSKIKDDKSQIINKISESLSPFQSANDSFAQNPNIFFYRELQSRPFWDSNMFEESLILESRFDVIHSEFQKLLSEKDGIGWKRNETPNGSWEVFHLVNQGSVVELNSQRCPETMAVISELPAGMFKNVFGNVSFSVVHPSTVISEHYGPTNIKLRCHLGLVSQPSYSLCVSDQSQTWEQGKTLVFDDSFLHSVSHTGMETDDFRAVLIVDIWHPSLTKEERDVIDAVFAPE